MDPLRTPPPAGGGGTPQQTPPFRGSLFAAALLVPLTLLALLLWQEPALLAPFGIWWAPPQLVNDTVVPTPARRRHGATALVIPTHQWSPSIEQGMRPFIDSALAEGMAVHVVFTPSLSTAKFTRGAHLDPRVCVNRTTPEAIRSLYPGRRGFYGMWKSSHFTLLWFWMIIGARRRYAHVWFIEADVRSAGNVARLWSAVSDDVDYVTSWPITILPPGHGASRKFVGPVRLLPRTRRFFALKQVIRMSARLLARLNTDFARGSNGQDESVLATLARSYKMRTAHLADFTDNTWTWDKKRTKQASAAWRRWVAGDPRGRGRLRLFHPVKKGR